MKLGSALNRFLLPGLAFKAVVVGGGYATGRELVEFFMPSGPAGGLCGMVVAMAIWSAVCTTTFCFAQKFDLLDYRQFFRALLGPGWIAFEILYFGFLFLVLAVFGSAAGAIGTALFGAPLLIGTLALIGCVLAVIVGGQSAAEALFKYVSILLYGVYIVFVALSLGKFGQPISHALTSPVQNDRWVLGGSTYAAYNLIGAVLVLPNLRYLQSRRDAVVAGLIAGPLAMLPAIAFFVCLSPYYPGIANEQLPSDYALVRLNTPIFHYAFQIMVFAALLECSVGFIQAFTVRLDEVARRRGNAPSRKQRAIVTAIIIFSAMFLATRVGLIDLIAFGYRLMAVGIFLVFLLPLLTIGLRKILSRSNVAGGHGAAIKKAVAR